MHSGTGSSGKRVGAAEKLGDRRLRLIETHAEGRRRYYGNGSDLVVEIATIEHHRGAGSLMSLWVNNGRMPRFVERTLNVNVFFTDESGRCVERFNPTVKPGGCVRDFDWVLEATQENEDRLLAEIERRYNEASR